MHTDNHAGIDVAVRRTASFGSGADAERDRIPVPSLPTSRRVDGVAAAAGRTSGWAQLVGPDGELLGDVSSGVDPVGENWIVDPQLNPWRLVDGAPPMGPSRWSSIAGRRRRSERPWATPSRSWPWAVHR
jgi:hypothetical protein